MIVSIAATSPCVITDFLKAQYAAVVAAFALSCSIAVMRNVNYDDILATAQKHNNSSKKPQCHHCYFH